MKLILGLLEMGRGLWVVRLQSNPGMKPSYRWERNLTPFAETQENVINVGTFSQIVGVVFRFGNQG